MSDRQKLFYAILASAFIHLAIVAALAILWTAQHAAEVVRALPDLSQLTVTIMPAKATPPPAAGKTAPVIAASTPIPTPKVPDLIDSDGLKKSTKAPDKAAFQSDENLTAGSQNPATGDMPLPSLAGPKRNFIDFADRPSGVGKTQAPAQPAVPEQTPTAITQVQHQPDTHPAPTAAPSTARIAESTPIPTPKPIPTAPPNTLAVGTPTPTPSPPSQLPTPVEQLARLTAPNPRTALNQPQPSHPAELPTQRETTKTRVNGSITAPGAPGVDAVETPYGRYRHKIHDLIGSRWNLYVHEHPKDVGDVTILVKLSPDGKVASTRVISNHSLDDLAELSTRAIMESDLPPVPDDLTPMLRDGKLEMSFNFTVYDTSNDDSSGR